MYMRCMSGDEHKRAWAAYGRVCRAQTGDSHDNNVDFYDRFSHVAVWPLGESDVQLVKNSIPPAPLPWLVSAIRMSAAVVISG